VSGFILYKADIADEDEQHQVNMHAYADDTQLYLHCRQDDRRAAITQLETAVINLKRAIAIHDNYYYYA